MKPHVLTKWRVVQKAINANATTADPKVKQVDFPSTIVNVKSDDQVEAKSGVAFVLAE